MFHVIHRTPMGIMFEQKVAASTIEEVVSILNIPVTKLPTICSLGGIPVLRKHWKTIDLGLQDELETTSRELVFTTIPQGDFFKNILSLIATIALTLVAPYAAGILGSVLGITSTIGLKLLAAGIVLAGSFLIGTFLSPTVPSQESQSASPTYSLSGQSNQARLFQPIPRLYGKHILYPDYAAQPYSEFDGNEQYLNQLFCLGVGTYQIHKMQIEDTPFWLEGTGMTDTYEGITFQIVQPGQPVTLFHSQVINSVEVSGQDIDSTTDWVGPYVANTADTITNKLQVDVIFPQGIFTTDDEGGFASLSASVTVQCRPINTAGLPVGVGTWVTLGTHTYTNSTPTPQRITYSYNVTDARYEVRIKRASEKPTSSRDRADMQWGGLRAFIPDDNIYADVTLLAIRMKATNQLSSSSSRKINVVQTSKLPIWNAITSTWSTPTATRSIAWIAADILRNQVYGAGYPDDYIDLEKLAELDVIWTNRGDTFNGVFDRTYSIWEALTLVLRTGRTSPAMIAGKVTFVRDELRPIPRGQFTPANIKRGSMEVQHILFDEESPDDIIIQFLDERTWRTNEVQCKQVGSVSDKPERTELFGITDRSQAWREGMFLGAVNAKRRIVANFTTEMAGRLLMRGDLISLAHDLYEWGQSGLVEGYDSLTRTMWLTEPMQWGSNTVSYIRLRKRNGESWGPVKIIPYDGDDYKVTVDGIDLTIVEASQGPITSTFNTDNDAVITSYIICYQKTSYKDFIIISGKPKEELVDITCIIEDPSVHTVDLGSPPVESYPFTGAVNPTRPVINFFSASEDVLSNPNAPRVIFAWAAATFATSYVLQISYDNVIWETVYQGPSTSFTYTILPGVLFTRVAGTNTQTGPWKTFSNLFGISSVSPLPTSNITYNYGVNTGTLSIEWVPAIRATSYRLEIWVETTPGSGIFNSLKITRNLVGTAQQFNSTEIRAVGGPWAAISIHVVSVNTLGESNPTIKYVAGITLDSVTSLSLQSSYNRNTFTVQWTASNATSYNVKVRVDGVEKLSYSCLTNTQQVTLADMITVGGPWREMVIGVTAIAGILTSSEAVITVRAPTITAVTSAGGSYGGTNVNISWNQTVDNGVEQTKVYRNSVNNFSTATLINTQTKASGEGVTYSDPRDPVTNAGTWYYYITAYDPTVSQESAPVGLMITI